MPRISTRFLNTFPPDEMLAHSHLMAERPFNIWGNLYFVGNSWCSSHLIDTGDGLILLDTPCLAELPYLLDSIWAVGFDPRELKIILISHAHHDHYGAAAALQAITGAKIFFGRVDAADMEARPDWFVQHNRERVPPEESFTADRLLEDGETITLGNTEIKCILTPGHTPGTMSHFWTAYAPDGRSMRVGIYGGAGFSTVRTEFLTQAGLPMSLQSGFVHSIDKVLHYPVDIMLGNHPCHNDTFAKRRRAAGGQPEAFVDPTEWERFLVELKTSYQTFMELTPREQSDLYGESHFMEYCGDHAREWFRNQGGMDMGNKNIQEIMEEAKLPLDISKLKIRTYLDIPYCSDGNPAHRLDIALPAEGEGPFPVVVFIHGGGFYYGYKRNVHTAAAWNTIPAGGFALVSIDYRLTPEAPWPAQIYDCKAAIRFLRTHGDQYHLDTERIGVWGNSAGGLLAAMVATTGDRPEYEDRSMGNPEPSSAVQAACVWYGIYDIPQFKSHWTRILKPDETPEKEDYDALGALLNNPAYDKEQIAAMASASHQVHDHMPPMLLFHGTGDHVVPYLQSVEFFEQYLRQNDHTKIHLDLFENAPHGGPAFANRENLARVVQFFRRWLILQ